MTSSASLNSEPRTLNPRWSPSGDDHLIYQWVVMQGKTQSEVAGMLKVHQSTISRVIQRYDRWRAHLKARENGALDRTERLRAQHQLTFERNELIMASCLRIAKEMEGFVDTSKSTISRPLNNYAKEHELRTVNATLDRTGMAARFYRLAFRINMEQLKLAAQDELPPAEPLTDQQLAQEAAVAASDAAELATFFGRFRTDPPPPPPTTEQNPVGWASPTTEQPAKEPDSVTETRPPVTKPATTDSSPSTPYSVPSTTSPPQSATSEAPSSLNPGYPLGARTLNPPLHNLHNETALQIAATQSSDCTWVPDRAPNEKSPCTCIMRLGQPRSPAPDEPINDLTAMGEHNPTSFLPTAAT